MTTATAVGVDGCRDGWIAAIASPGSPLRLAFFEHIRTLLKTLPEEAVVLVDMIIGLPNADHPSRECDQLARQQLRPHSARVFSAPPREALAAESYADACRAARLATGKAISKQCWYLFPKIRELDALRDHRLCESHPELVFARFNGNCPVAESKKTTAGEEIRLALLEERLRGSLDAFHTRDRCLPKVRYLADDCIDALALCAAAQGPRQLRRLPENRDLPGIWY